MLFISLRSRLTFVEIDLEKKPVESKVPDTAINATVAAMAVLILYFFQSRTKIGASGATCFLIAWISNVS